MNRKDFFKKAFGKEKDEKVHALAMLLIYAIFMIIVVVGLRFTIPHVDFNTDDKKANTTKKSTKDDITVVEKKETGFDINYSYSYNIVFDGETETYLGKKIDEKEKFSYIKGDTTLEYAIYNDNHLLLKDGIYHITDSLDTYFKYCDTEKILDLIETKESEEDGTISRYTLDNDGIARIYGESVAVTDATNNTLEIVEENDNIKTIVFDLNNYISAKLGGNHTLKITMEFADIGTTEDFELKIG